jgi:Ca2+-binding EF-hand superfamily protein
MGLPKHFDITLKREEILKLFKEIDNDKDGLIKLREFE